jgi:O-antigen/teichoic acid export membrane protein
MRQLLKSTTFRAAAAFAIAGLAHAVGALLLARQLPEIQFAYVALFLAFLDFGAPVGAGGADTVVIRHKLTATPALLRRVLATSLAVAVMVYFVARQFYEFSALLALVTAFAIVVGARNRVAASIWQSMQQFRVALLQLQSSHVVLALLAVAAIAFGWQTALLICALHAAYLAVLGAVGWRKSRHARPDDAPGLARYPWIECLPIVFITAGAQLAMQTERLLIPHLLQIEDLALYGVLAAVVGSPFQMLSIAVGYTLMPRLKALDSAAQRASILRKEALLVLALAVTGAFLAWLLGPWIARLFVGDKFLLTTPLILAAILVGLGKVGNAFPASIVKTLGDAADLNWLSAIGWLGLAISVGAAWALAGGGMPGLLVGVAIGWAVRILLSLALAQKVLRTSAS